MIVTGRKSRIWDLVKAREEKIELRRRALAVGLCPECGENVKKTTIGRAGPHGAAGDEVKYSYSCGFEYLRVE